jgi:hypothetical protein
MVAIKVGTPFDQETIKLLIQEVQGGTDLPYCRSWAIRFLWNHLDEQHAATTDGGMTK